MKKLFYFACAAAFTLSLASCNSDNNGNGTDNGKTDPSGVAKESLVAYFPFDGDGVEKIANITPKVARVSRGQREAISSMTFLRAV